MGRILFAILLGLLGKAYADGYANFFNDQFCEQDGGIGVDMDNDGCLNEPGRGSVYIGNYPASYGLCTYNQAGCAGGSDGDAWWFTSTGFCEVLETAGAYSYRFISPGET